MVKGFLSKGRNYNPNPSNIPQVQIKKRSQAIKVRLRKSRQKDLVLFPLHEKIRHYFHFKKRFAVITQSYRIIFGLKPENEFIQN